jgi:glutaryl-CoA dehydrogenase
MDPSDFYALETLLPDDERKLLAEFRDWLQAEVAPLVNRYWSAAAFPHEILPSLAALGPAGQPLSGYGCPGRSWLFQGMLAMEIATVDPSIATFYGVHCELAMESIYFCGSEEQKKRWIPPMSRWEQIGAFGLTEPDVGSGTAGGLTTTARRDGDEWVLNGEKKWIGNATFADLVVIWARDLEDNQVKGFVVQKDTPGFTTSTIEGKMALRIVQNALITLKDVRVAESDRLQNANSFRDTATVLRQTRAGVAWMAVGCMRGAFLNCLDYAKTRNQFGKPIASFQLVQDLLSRMLGNITASAVLCTRLSQLQDQGLAGDEQSALAKMFCTVRMREAVGWARELMGGNGILIEHNVGRFVADAEAIYSYEGTREMQSLIVGRAITGHSAFV